MGTNPGAVAAGLVLGAMAALVWNTVSTRLGHSNFWPEFSRLACSLLAVEGNGDFLKQYTELLKLSMRYVGRNVLATGASVLPVAFCIYFFIEPLFARYREGESSASAPDVAHLGAEVGFYTALGLGSVVAMIVLWKRR